MRNDLAFCSSRRRIALCAALTALLPLASACGGVVTIADGTSQSVSSSSSGVSASSSGGASTGTGGAGGSSEGGGGAGGTVPAPIIPSTPWAIGVGSPDALDLGTSVAVDAGGSIFMAGSVQADLDFGSGKVLGYATIGKSFLAKLSADGEPLWLKRIPTISQSAVAVDSQGSLWAMGKMDVPGIFGGPEIVQYLDGFILARYTSAGEVLWSNSVASSNALQKTRLTPSANGGMFVVGLLAGSSSIDYDNIHIADDTGSFNHVVVLSIDASGKGLWGRNIDDELLAKPMVGYTFPVAAGAAPGGGVVVHAGSTVLKLDPGGTTLWATHAKAGTPSGEARAAVAVAPGGAVVISGPLTWDGKIDFGGGPLGTSGLYVVKLDPQGKHVWSKGLDQTPVGMGVDPNGFISVVGSIGYPAYGAALTRLSPAGDVLSTRLWNDDPNGTSVSSVVPTSLAVDGGGNALLTGMYTGPIDFGTGVLPLTTTTSPGTPASNIFVAKLVP